MLEESRLSRRKLLALGSLSLTATPVSGILPSLALAAAASKAQHKSCIVLFMQGGPSHIDTFDPKPDAPEGRGGPLKPIATNLPGVQVTELFPKMAQRMKDVCLVRSMSTPSKDHARAEYLIRTGRLPTPNVDYPALGSVTASLLGDPQYSLPKYVFLGARARPTIGASAGYLGARHEPLSADNGKVERAAPATSWDRYAKRLELLDNLEQQFERTRPTDIAATHRAVIERSLRMMRSEHLSAFDIEGEPTAIQEAYGDTDFGRNCLRARRLVEAGVPFVEVVSTQWDHHSAMYTSDRGIKNKSAEVDSAFAALIDDLRSRSLLDSTLVVWMGEFGRTPKLAPLPGGGRDHYSDAWTTLLAGAGLKVGQVIGRTDKSGATVEDRPVSAVDFLATICLAIGIDPNQELPSPNDRPIPIVDNQTQTPKPLVELLG